MGNRFLSKGFGKNSNDDDDLVQRQLSALSDSTGESKLANNDNGAVETADIKKSDEQHSEATRSAPEEIKKSVLQPGLVVTGSITSVTPLYVYGTVNGDIACESDVTIDGNIEGNINAGGIQVLSGQVKGDIESKSVITVFKDANIVGNISGESFSCDGKIHGNTIITGKAAIKENAVIAGDIVCGKISISEGAVCKGNIQTETAKEKSTVEVKAEKKVAAKAAISENAQTGVAVETKKFI